MAVKTIADLTALASLAGAELLEVQDGIGAGASKKVTAAAISTYVGTALSTTYQPLDATLTALAGANWALNSVPLATGADTVSQTAFGANTFLARASTGDLAAKPVTDFGLSLVDDADATAARSTLGLVVGTNVQAWDATLDTFAAMALTGTANSTTWVSGDGTFKNHLTGPLGVGAAPATARSLYVSQNITGAATAYGATVESVVQSDATTAANGFYTNLGTAASVFTALSLRHFYAEQGTIGAGSTVTSQFGFAVSSNLTGAANNYGFYSNIAAASNRWNFHAAGTAQNYMAGRLGLGIAASTSRALNIGIDITGATNSAGIVIESSIKSDVTAGARIFQSRISTEAASFTLSSLHHFQAQYITLGAGSAITTQVGFLDDGTLTTAANNYGFYSLMPAAAGRWCLYMSGGADSAIVGNTRFGNTTAPTAKVHMAAGTTAASTAPLKFTSGSLMTTAEAGAVEFLTDAFYGTITTGAARKTFAFLEAPIFTTSVQSPIYKSGSDQVVGAREAAVASASGGAIIDAEARTAINTLLARLRTHGLIAT